MKYEEWKGAELNKRIRNLEQIIEHEMVCECVRGGYIQCGYCSGWGTIEEGVDGASAGDCHCCKPYEFNKFWSKKLKPIRIEKGYEFIRNALMDMLNHQRTTDNTKESK